jgi:hypothetical protein
MLCPRCSSKIAPDDRFCGKCGHRLDRQPAGLRSQIPRLPRLSPNRLRIAGGILAGVIIIALMLIILPLGKKRKPVPRPSNLGAELTDGRSSKRAEEVGARVIYGRMTSLRRGSMTIRSLTDGIRGQAHALRTSPLSCCRGAGQGALYR